MLSDMAKRSAIDTVDESSYYSFVNNDLVTPFASNGSHSIHALESSFLPMVFSVVPVAAQRGGSARDLELKSNTRIRFESR